MRGYSATKPDGNLAQSPQSLRRQFGEIYALNLDRNIQSLRCLLIGFRVSYGVAACVLL